MRRGARTRPRLAPARRRRPPPPFSSFRSTGRSCRGVWRCAAPRRRRRRLPKGCPTRGAAGKLLDEALPGHYVPDAHLDVIMPALLACETFVLVDHDRRRRRRYRSQFMFAGVVLDKALLYNCMTSPSRTRTATWSCSRTGPGLRDVHARRPDPRQRRARLLALPDAAATSTRRPPISFTAWPGPSGPTLTTCSRPTRSASSPLPSRRWRQRRGRRAAMDLAAILSSR